MIHVMTVRQFSWKEVWRAHVPLHTRDNCVMPLAITCIAAVSGLNAMTFGNIMQICFWHYLMKKMLLLKLNILSSLILSRSSVGVVVATAITVITWYHQFDDRRFCIMNNRTNNIPQRSDSRNRGWYSELTTSSSYQQLKLLRDVNYVPFEGFFFCANDRKYISIGIH